MTTDSKWVFTFGVGIDDPHRSGYHVIHAPDEKTARALMFERFGKHWAFMYRSEEEAGVEQWGLHQVK